MDPPPAEALDYGGIVGSVVLDSWRMPQVGFQPIRLENRWWSRACYGWMLRDPEPSAFVRCMGALGFFRVPHLVRQALDRQPKKLFENLDFCTAELVDENDPDGLVVIKDAEGEARIFVSRQVFDQLRAGQGRK